MLDSKQQSFYRGRRSGALLPLIFVALGASILAPGRLDAGPQKPAQPDPQFQTLIRSTEGADLFRAYCASCHGRDAKGHGPAAPALKATVPDLTMITRNNGGDFPVDRIRRIITGDHVVASHGSREMPIWGPVFHQVEADIDRGNVRLDNLIKYLESIQASKHA